MITNNTNSTTQMKNNIKSLRTKFSIGQVLCIFLIIWSNINAYSNHTTQNTLYNTPQQLTWTLIAILAFFITSTTIKHLQKPWFILTLIPLTYIALWLTIYKCPNTTDNWYELYKIQIQPSEFSKPIFIISIIILANKLKTSLTKLWQGYLPCLLLLILWLIPIIIQKDYQTALLYSLTFIAILWIMGSNNKHIIATLITVITLTILPHKYQPTQKPANTTHSNFKQTLSNSGLYGKLLPHKHQQLPTLTSNKSLFITITKALGFIGIVPIILGFLCWLIYNNRLSQQITNPIIATTIIAIVIMFTIQAFLYLSINLHIPIHYNHITSELPFISYRESTLVATLISIAIAEGLSKNNEESPAKT